MGECFSSDSSGAERWVTFKFYTSVPSSPCFEYYKPIHKNFFQMKSIVFNGFERYIYNRYRTLYGKHGNNTGGYSVQFSQTMSLGQSPNHVVQPSNSTAPLTQFNNYMTHQNHQSSIHSYASLTTTGGNKNTNNGNGHGGTGNARRVKKNYQNLKEMFINAKKSDTFIDHFIQIEYKKLKLRNQYDNPIIIESSQQWSQIRNKSDLMFYIRIKCKKLEKYHPNGAFVLAQLIGDTDYLNKYQKSRYESEMQESKENELYEEKEQDNNKHNTNKTIGKRNRGKGKKNIKYKKGNNNNRNTKNGNNGNNKGYIDQGNIGSDEEYQTDYDDDEKERDKNDSEPDVMPLTGLHVSVTPAEPKGSQTSSLLKDRTGVNTNDGTTLDKSKSPSSKALQLNQNDVSAQI